MHLLAGGWRALPGALLGSPLGLLGRVRAVLGQGAARRGQAPPYRVWLDLYDMWGESERRRLLALSRGRAIEVAVLAGGNDANLSKTMRSLAAQWRPPARIAVIRKAADWTKPVAEWVVILCAGESLAAHALACLAAACADTQAPSGFCADFDVYAQDGSRGSPGLRPPPDQWSIRSALFADGAWMFHRDALPPHGIDMVLPARQARLAIAGKLPVTSLHYLPVILTHIEKHESSALPASVPDVAARLPRVSVLVPSACRSRHVLKCLRQVARATDYPDFEILLAMSATDRTDARQAAIMRKLASLPHVRLIDLAMPDFNFATVINKAALFATGEKLLLLNDDVAPIESDWLRRMVAFTQGGARADIVGARLLYGNGLVQHNGVIMGLANLCEHAFRLARRIDPGPQGLAHLDRQVSAVTAACMLVDASLFASLGGMDEAFAIALNDVDFCLRAGEAGARIVIAAGVELYHFESLSLGRHYQGARAGLEAREVQRLRDRWAKHIFADQFYHPCASLEPGREFEPGFPPRQTPLSWIGREEAARH